MEKKEIKIARGVSDVENVIKHLNDQEKKARKEAWLKENYSKIKRKESHD